MIDLGFEPQVVGVLEAMPSTNLKPTDENQVRRRSQGARECSSSRPERVGGSGLDKACLEPQSLAT